MLGSLIVAAVLYKETVEVKAIVRSSNGWRSKHEF
jgi:hypothetical protein